MALPFENPQNARWIGTGKLVWSMAFYDTSNLAKVYQEVFGNKNLLDTARDEKCPKLAIVSTAMNQPRLSPYVFRNYRHSGLTQSHFPGSCRHSLWEALLASCAAPGYFEEVQLDDFILQDGGIVTNNPSAVAIHEARVLWPDLPVHCLVSVGTGRYEARSVQTAISLKHKLTKIVESATDTEGTHLMLHDLMPPASYFRFNPYLTEQLGLDEVRPEKLDQLKVEASLYVRRNTLKLNQCVARLSQGKGFWHSGLDYLRHVANVSF